LKIHRGGWAKTQTELHLLDQGVDLPIFGVVSIAVALSAIAGTTARVHESEVWRRGWLAGLDVKVAHVVLREPLPVAARI